MFGTRIELGHAQFLLFRSQTSDAGVSDEAILDAIRPLLDQRLIQFLRSKYVDPHMLDEGVHQAVSTAVAEAWHRNPEATSASVAACR